MAAPVAAAAGLELNVQCPLDIGSDISLPEPDICIAPVAGRDEYPSAAVLVFETGVTSVRYALGRKADMYASADVPDYWVLDVQRRVLIVHRGTGGRPLHGYPHARRARDGQRRSARPGCAGRVSALIPPLAGDRPPVSGRSTVTLSD